LAANVVSLKDKENADHNDSIDDTMLLEILSIANGGASEGDIKSKIPRLAKEPNLFNEFIGQLLKSELLGVDDSVSNKFITTDKGLTFLEGYERVAAGSEKTYPPKGLLHAP